MSSTSVTAMDPKFLVDLVVQDVDCKQGLNIVWYFLKVIISAIICWLFCRKLTKELCEVVEDYGLVSFTTLNIQVCKHSP